MRRPLLIAVCVLFCSVVGAQSISLATGDVIFYADSPESTNMEWFYVDLSADSLAKTKERVQNIEKSYQLYDCILRDKWKYKTEKYNDMKPLASYNERIVEVYGQLKRIYMYAPNLNKAPKIGGTKDKIRWSDHTEMRLVIFQMTPNGKFWDIMVLQHCNILLYYKELPTVKEAKQIINK